MRLQDDITVVIPAFRAERTLPGAVASLLHQTEARWRAIVVADDETDYETLLAEIGLRDRRLQFLSTGGTGSGASATRNCGLDAARTRYLAVLDADDRMKPTKLARLREALGVHAIVSTALDVKDASGTTLRSVGAGADRRLVPGDYKFVNLSMDSMIGWDREACDGRYDPTLPNMNDLELLLQLLQGADHVFHIGEPLHDYIKQPASLSNGDGFTERMVRAKRDLLGRLQTNHYRFAEPGTAAGMVAFLAISLEAETTYPAALVRRPDLLFEDHLEPQLYVRRSAAGA